MEPWYDPNLYGWIPGTVFGCLGGGLGAATGRLASRGKARGVIMALWTVWLGVAGVLFVLAAWALWVGQPYGVWYGLGLPGVLGFAIGVPICLSMRRAYTAWEMKRMDAEDL